MQIEQVVAGVNGDTTAQAVQLRMRDAFQNLVGKARLVAYDAQGQNPIVLIDFTTSVPGGELGDRVLVISPGMLAHTSPTVTPDFVFDNTIPASYLDAGRITFEDDFGSVFWSLAYGGANYTGPTTGLLVNDPDGEFGPPWPGPLPTTGHGLLFQGPAGAPSASNAADYALTPLPAVLTNNAGESFTITLDPPCYADCDGNGALDIFDFLCFQNSFVLGEAYACDCDPDPACDIFDFLCFQNAFVAGCP
ncbi:MAG: hypothetical protein IH985_08665 [Planctomycetes bacterium]|nr:hypothetical protein [Planctomycetota bacterium]